MRLPLPQITALARAGALDRAWALFREAGYDAVTGDAAVLAVKGRLLKDLALREGGVARIIALSNAEAAYAAAAALDPQPWLLINVATLAAFRGDAQRASAIAGDVLARLDGSGIAETPYFIAATRAEAHLLRGEMSQASAALSQAVAASPDNWSDRATTLRQLSHILTVRGEDARWLDPFRPPRSLHFAGHLGVAPSGDVADRLASETRRIVVEDHIGFAWGAIAAGADIIIAEALIEAGAALHLVLPTDVDEFRRQSVSPLGAAWEPRYDALIALADSVACATDIRGAHEPLATLLASEVAMGAAARNARACESEAIQFLVADEDGGGMNTARQGDFWMKAGRRQIALTLPRDVPPSASAQLRPDRVHPTRRLAAMLHIELVGADEVAEEHIALLADAVLTPVGSCLRKAATEMLTASGQAWFLSCAEVDEAARLALEVQVLFQGALETQPMLPPTLGLRIVGHFALVHQITDEATGHAVLIGPDARLPERLSPLVPAGAISVTEPFAAALFASGEASYPTEFIGDPVVPETGRSVRLYAVKAGPGLMTPLPAA